MLQLDSDYRSGEFDFQYGSDPTLNTTSNSATATADHAIKSRAFIDNHLTSDGGGGPSSGDTSRHPGHTAMDVLNQNQRGVKRGLQEVWDAGASSTGGAQSQGTEGRNPEGDGRGTDSKLGEQRLRY